MPRCRPSILALLTALGPTATAFSQAIPNLTYRDNPRPILLDLDPGRAPIAQVAVYMGTPPRARLLLEPLGPATAETGPRRVLNPTLRAKAEGRALPTTAYVGQGIGRFCHTASGEMGLFWGLSDHVGAGYWPLQGGAREPVLAAARALEHAYQEPGPTRWLEYARTLPAGSAVVFLFADRGGNLRILGGSEQEARQEADRQLRLLLSSGLGWRPVRGMHSPSFVATEPSSISGVLLAGPVLLAVDGPAPESALRHLAGFVRRPLPEAPRVGENPLGPGG